MAVVGARVTVATTPTVVFAPAADDSDGAAAVIRNQGSETIDLGGSGVTSGAGFRLAVSETVTVQLAPGESLYGISPTTNNVVDVLKVNA